jgi:nucleotide sugar dehydrogenase
MRIETDIPADTRATVFIITVGTPLDANGRARMDMITASSEGIARILKQGDMVIMRSTVRLGTTRQVVMPILDRVGVAYDIAFCPERTVEGQALSELRQLPQIVGAATSAASVRAARLFNALTPTIVRVPSLEVAEVTKLIDNTYRDITFAFANEVAQLCDAVGISAHDVITAGKLGYPRTSVPLPGPVGGPCLNKDTHILAESARGSGYAPRIALTARGINELQPADIVRRLRRYVAGLQAWPSVPTIAVLGLAFKGRPVTDDLRGTMAKPLVDALLADFPGARLRLWDALARHADVRKEFGMDAETELGAAAAGANLVLIANNHPCFQELLLDEFAESLAKPAIIYDFWNHFSARDAQLPAGVRYIGLGDGQLPLVDSRTE